MADKNIAPDLSPLASLLPDEVRAVRTAVTPRRRLQMAWRLFEALENQVQVADSKVQAVFGVNALLVAALSLQSHQSSWSELRAAGFGTSHFLALIVRIAFLICVSVATGSAIAALRPRTKRSRSKSVPLPALPASLFFFNDIARKTPLEYQEAFFGLTTEEATEHLVLQSHAVANVLSAKYRYAALAVGLMLWALLQVVDFVS